MRSQVFVVGVVHDPAGAHLRQASAVPSASSVDIPPVGPGGGAAGDPSRPSKLLEMKCPVKFLMKTVLMSAKVCQCPFNLDIDTATCALYTGQMKQAVSRWPA